MSIELLHYWPLTLLIGLVALIWWQKHTVAPLSAKRRRISLLIRCVIFTLLIFALTEPQWIGKRRDQYVFWLVDASRSVATAARDASIQFAASAAQNPAIKKSAFIAFAGKPQVFQNSDALAKLNATKLDDEATDIDGALSFADASFPAGYAKTVVLFSDGQETRGNVIKTIAHLRDSGVRIYTVPVQPPDRPEVLVQSVEAPHQVNDDEPFKVTAQVVSNRDTDATVDVFRNGPRVSSKPVRLKKGVNHFEFTQTIGAGDKACEFTVAVQAKEDTLADNNQASAFVLSTGKSKALLIADKPDQARYLARALKQEGVLLDVRPATGAPADMSDLQNYDLLILDNVPATDLTPRQMELYSSYVRDFGGGFLMLGGEQSFGLGGYYHTPVEEMLPVRCDFEKEQENPSLGLVLVIDHSGSMSGEKMEMAKDAAKAAVELLGPKDYVGVIAFDHEAFWVCDIQQATDKSGVEQKISTIQAEGGTAMGPAMEMALSKLSMTPAKLKHIILLTDGISTPGPFYELATQMTQQQMTLSTVGLGGDADQELLKKIAEWGNGRFYFTDNPQSVPQIFAKETMTASKSAIHEMPFLPIQTAPVDFLNGIDFQSAPFLLGYVTTKPKPTAECWLVTEKKEPLLATWRYGLGQVGAFTSDARNRWAVEWLKWDGYGKMWVQFVRKLMRTGMMKHFPAELTRDGDEFYCTVDCANEKGEYISDATGQILVAGPDGHNTRLSLDPIAPGKYEAHWPAKRGGYHVELAIKQGESVIDQQYLSASAGYPDEFLLRPADENKLKTIATETGGTYQPKPGDIPDDRSVSVERELWPWLAGVALLLFLADVAAKRWPDASRFRSKPAANRQPSKPLKPMPENPVNV